MTNKNTALITLCTALLVYTSSVRAEEWSTSASLVVTHQFTNEQDIKKDTEASADVFISRQSGKGEWQVHFEGVTTPNMHGVSGVLPEANGDVGSALDQNDQGRVQLSELYYQHTFNKGQLLSVGLIDVSGFFEQSRIASDETTQFLGASFTGNPSIAFPDYTLGLVYEHKLPSGPVLRAAIARSKGIADNTRRSYSQLLSVDNDNKGLFAIASSSWLKNQWLFRVGLWTNTADHEAIDGSDNNASNYGSYMLAGYQQGQHAFNLRMGVAKESVSQASAFSSIGYQFKQGDYVLGAGMARAFLSKQEPNQALGDTSHFETYLRYAYSPAVFLTADIQHIVNSNFGALMALQDKGITVYGLRLSYLYE